MAAIKHIDPDTGKPEIVAGRHHSGDSVLVRMEGGTLLRVPLLGFWYVGGERLRAGRYVKLFASEITNESGNLASVWRPVAQGESVLAWAAPGMRGWEDFGIYGMTDRQGWPVIVKASLAEVEELDAKTG